MDEDPSGDLIPNFTFSLWTPSTPNSTISPPRSPNASRARSVTSMATSAPRSATAPNTPKAKSAFSRLQNEDHSDAEAPSPRSEGDDEQSSLGKEGQARGTPRARRGKREPQSPHQALLQMTFGGHLRKLSRKPWFAFVVAQLFVIWLVAVVVVFMHDLAAQMKPRQKLKSALGSQGFMEKLSQRLKDRCPLQGPVCRMNPSSVSSFDPSPGRDLRADAMDIAELPTVIFFAGIEGSGHKFFEQVFRHLPVNFSVVAFEPDLHLTAEETQQLAYKEKVDAKCPLLPYARPLRGFAKEMLKRLKEAGSGPYIRARDSYPLGRVRTPLARPDLLHLLELDGHIYNLKVVVLQRGLADAVRSTFRMGYHMGDVGLQARIVEDEMAILDTSLRLLPCGKYIVLDFDWTADDPKLIAQPLAEFLDLGVSADDVVAAVKGAVQSKPKHQTEYPEFGKQPIEEFFALRTDMWPLLAAARLSPYFWPHHPRDWPEESADAPFLFERRRGFDFD